MVEFHHLAPASPKTRAERKAARRSPEPGFTPVPNARINAAFANMLALNAAANAERQAKGLPTVPYGEDDAWRDVARTLPASNKRKLRFRPTKNADPAYRKGIWPAAKVARRSAA